MYHTKNYFIEIFADGTKIGATYVDVGCQVECPIAHDICLEDDPRLSDIVELDDLMLDLVTDCHIARADREFESDRCEKLIEEKELK